MAVQFVDIKTLNKPKNIGHTKPKPPLMDINQEGRYRVCNLLSIFNISHSTLYAGIKTGRYPAPDGKDGSFPFWKTSTIRLFLNGGQS